MTDVEALGLKRLFKDLQEVIMDVMKDMEYIATMRTIMIEKKEEAVKKAAGMETITMSPEEAKKFLTICYDKTWEYVMGMAS